MKPPINIDRILLRLDDLERKISAIDRRVTKLENQNLYGDRFHDVGMGKDGF